MSTINNAFLTMKNPACLMDDKNIVVKLLNDANTYFAEVHDAHSGTFQILIRTDIKDQCLCLTYDEEEHFVSLDLTVVSSFNALIGAYISATFAASQFSYIHCYRGKNVFAASQFKRIR